MFLLQYPVIFFEKSCLKICISQILSVILQYQNKKNIISLFKSTKIMTIAESRFFETGTRFFSSNAEKKEPNWETRRYEVTKDIYTALVSNKDLPLEELADYAVKASDILINKLKQK